MFRIELWSDYGQQWDDEGWNAEPNEYETEADALADIDGLKTIGDYAGARFRVVEIEPDPLAGLMADPRLAELAEQLADPDGVVDRAEASGGTVLNLDTGEDQTPADARAYLYSLRDGGDDVS